MKTSCPYCRTPVVHSETFLNKRVVCPKCQKQFIIPDPQGITKAPATVAESPGAKNHGLLACSIIGGIVALGLVTCGVVGVLLLREKKPATQEEATASARQEPAQRPIQRLQDRRPQQTPEDGIGELPSRPAAPSLPPPAQRPPIQAPPRLRPAESPSDRGGDRLEDLKRQLESKTRPWERKKAADFLVLDAEGYADGDVVLDFLHQERVSYAQAADDASATGRTHLATIHTEINRLVGAFYGTPVRFDGTVRSVVSRRTSVVRGGRTYPAATWALIVVNSKQRQDEPPDEISLHIVSEGTFDKSDKVAIKGQFQSISGVTERAFHERPLHVTLGDAKVEKRSVEQTKTEPPPAKPKPTEDRIAAAPPPKNRLPEATEEDLRKQLLVGVPEVGLNQDMDTIMYGMMKPPRTTSSRSPFSRSRTTTPTPPVQVTPDFGPQFYTRLARSKHQDVLATLPWRSYPHCQLGKEPAETLNDLSLALRACLRSATPTGHVRPDAANLRRLLATPGRVGRIGGSVTNRPTDWKTKAAIPALMQLLQVENAPVREVLVELLSDIPGEEASDALAKRALFDLSGDVRRKAAQALSKRPTKEYQAHLVAAFRYPWPAASIHAANALVELNDKSVVSAVEKLKDEPNPQLPFSMEIQKKNGKEKVLAKRELVRINHMCNCLLCHAPSTATTDMVRGRVPIPNETPPQLYYAEKTGEVFARADTTFLRQDFSVVQPITGTGTWPGDQRYDYLARVRQLTKKEMLELEKLPKDQPLPYIQRDAVRFVLKELVTERADDQKTFKEGISRPKDGEQP